MEHGEASLRSRTIPHYELFSYVLTVLLFVVGLGLFIIVDSVMTWMGLYTFSFPLKPYLVMLGLSLPVAVPIWGFNQRRSLQIRVSLISMVVVMAISVGLLGGGSAKVFQRDLARVKPGMTQDEVELIMGGWIRGTGFPANPFTGETGELKIQNAQVYRHTNEGCGNADWGIVKYDVNGRVVGVKYSPD